MRAIHLGALLSLVLLAGCMERPKQNPLPRTQSLYTYLGGEPVLTHVADDLVAKIQANDNIAQSNKDRLRDPAFKQHLVKELGALLGGPQQGKPDGLQGLITGKIEGNDDRLVVVGTLEGLLDDKAKLLPPANRDEVKKALAPVRAGLVGG